MRVKANITTRAHKTTFPPTGLYILLKATLESNQGLQAYYPATQHSLVRGTKQIMRMLKENNTSATGSEAVTLPSVPSACPQRDIPPKLLPSNIINFSAALFIQSDVTAQLCVTLGQQRMKSRCDYFFQISPLIAILVTVWRKALWNSEGQRRNQLSLVDLEDTSTLENNGGVRSTG